MYNVTARKSVHLERNETRTKHFISVELVRIVKVLVVRRHRQNGRYVLMRLAALSGNIMAAHVLISSRRLYQYRRYVRSALRGPPHDACEARSDPSLEQFVKFYYDTFDGDRTQLAALYVRARC